MRRIALVLLLVLGAPSCGGKSKGSPDDDGNAGRPSAGGSGGGKAGSPSGGGAVPKLADCQFEGHFYISGESFPSPDGCNTCGCQDGDIVCTEIGCLDECSSIVNTYQGLINRAKDCDPAAANECTHQVASSLTCGCDTYVNPAGFSRDAVAYVVEQFAANACGEDVLCGPCPAPNPAGYCGANGQCTDTPQLPVKRACKVADVIYASGSPNIQDPFSCNQCTCDDGMLSCDNAACPKPCPAGTNPGQGCAQCGPIDNCLIVEYGCMPACVETCAQGACVNGACVSACG